MDSISLLVFKCKHSLAHLSKLESQQRLRSSSSSAFVMPATRRSTLGDRSFSAANTRAWNSLPPTVTAVSTLSSFRRHLKSHLFTKSFPSWRWLLLADLMRCDCVKCPCSFQLYVTLINSFLHSGSSLWMSRSNSAVYGLHGSVCAVWSLALV